MKILMVLEREYPEDERVSKEIRTLQKEGHQVLLACFTKQTRAANETLNEITIFRKPISEFIEKTSVGSLKFPFYFNFWRSFIQKIIRGNKVDVLHIHDLQLAKVGYEIARQNKLKFVLDLHENWPVLLELSPHTKSLLGRLLSNNKQWLAFEKKYATLADGLVVVAEEMKQRLLSKGVINENIAVVPNTSNAGIFENLDSETPDPEFITMYYAGGINEHRGLDITIKGMAKMKLPANFRFWIIGWGKSQVHLENMVAEFNLNKHVYFLGRKTHKEVLQYLLKSDIAVIPHLKNEHTDNTSPNKVFHYMAAKKPVLSSDCNYLVSVLNKSKAGLIYKNNSPTDFAEKLQYLLENKSLWKEFGEKGYQSILTEFNWDNTSKPIVKLYHSI